MREIELLAPGGDVDSIKAAIIAGADAIYCGLDKFNARNRAANINFDELNGVIRLAHSHQCQIFLTLNILILENEIPALVQLLNKLSHTNIDGIIVQDLGLLYILSSYFKTLRIHASTQMTTHNAGQLQFLAHMDVERANLCRELNLAEIKYLSTQAKKHNMQSEVFIHGSQCVSFSGICYMSSVMSGHSGNRGRCSQPCRDRYASTQTARQYPLNLKDNAGYHQIGALYNAGVDSLKIEGRMKKYDYIYTVVKTYKKQIENWQKHQELLHEKEMLYKVFNRDLSNGYLTNKISKEMFIDNPRDYSILRLKDQTAFNSTLTRQQNELYDEKENIKQLVKNKIQAYSIEKQPVRLQISGESGLPLRISVQTTDHSFEIHSTILLHHQGNEPLNEHMLLKRLKAINNSLYYISEINLDKLKGRLYLPFKELTSLKDQILYLLGVTKKNTTSVQLAPIDSINQITAPSLSVIISSQQDVSLISETDSPLYFKLPSMLRHQLQAYIDIFKEKSNLIPWFPTVLMEDEYTTAIEFIRKVQPKVMVTDNSGIAFFAYRNGIKWIAGPAMNIVNSYSLQCVKEKFNASGAFISNELSRVQIKGIHKPTDFKLYYSIYHPNLLMTSRQCFTQQTIGCPKKFVDSYCIDQCEKYSTITHSTGDTFFIEKTKGNYHRIYSHQHYLNTEIVDDKHQKFDSFFIDLSKVKTDTKIKCSNIELIQHFTQILKGDSEAKKLCHHDIHPTTNKQFKKGI
ncbi:peptidase U32 family protein [Saccharicrinis fermentans]|uniref:Putative protease YhbU n=1 Tax=Saccharicrinis fermentans DSM 9555 = JCM 21142 TaxID=869213 RepID=W7XYG8_9BACT|nr:U32 family peptidase [Saccharicrinis fermentans]GAF03655.1 putative protease YhbU precursor [Saccharicrinis fermentans DSM 9555 = JCM 21142]